MCMCVHVCVRVGALGPTSYQENGAKETEAGDRKLEEEAAPIVPAQHCSYSNRQQGGKSERDWGSDLARCPFLNSPLTGMWAGVSA